MQNIVREFSSVNLVEDAHLEGFCNGAGLIKWTPRSGRNQCTKPDFGQHFVRFALDKNSNKTQSSAISFLSPDPKIQ